MVAPGMPDIPGNPKVSRKLVAILAADIAGYTALMGADEEATVRDLKAHQAVILPMIGTHAGRVIDTAGDGILAEFASVLNAVECAIAIQRVIAERNVAIDPSRRMQFRIGVKLGDVIVHDLGLKSLKNIVEPLRVYALNVANRPKVATARGQSPLPPVRPLPDR